MSSRYALALRTPGQTCGHQPNCGCQFAPCCFECPLPECKFILGSRGLQRLFRQQKACKLRAAGMKVGDIASRLGVAKSTIWTYTRNGNNSKET